MNDNKLWKIIDKEFISYSGGYAYLISNCDCTLKEASFTKMGGFTMERDGRGRYNICSENVIPKNSAVIRIAAPDCTWNDIVADIFTDILTMVGETK